MSIFLGASPISALENEAKRGKPWILVPEKTTNYGYYDGVKVYTAPVGKPMLEVPRGLKISVVKRIKGWAQIIITNPFFAKGWVKEANVGQIVCENTLFYGSASTKGGAKGWIRQGVVVRKARKRGKLMEVQLHHLVPLTVYIPESALGIKFGPYKNVPYSYYSRWQRNLFEVTSGPIFLAPGKPGLVATLNAKTKMKIEKYQGDWAQVASPSDYDIKF
ncbi:hypothetical protein KKF84_02445, partial [Myxococcota bacterium]|nr:hypothetical protein [Myxococcota bacterium]